MIRKIFALIIAVFLLSVLSAAQAQVPIDCSRLFGCSQFGELFSIEINTGEAKFIGIMEGEFPLATEIEYDPMTNILYAEECDGFEGLNKLDPTTGGFLERLIHEYGSLNGLEFVGSTLYGTFIMGSGSPSDLVIVDTTTGELTTIGPTGVGPVSGLAYDQSTGVMYGITAGGGPAILITIDLKTGAASKVGGTGFIRIGSIEFGPDGNLYGGTTGLGFPFPNYLIRIDKATGEAKPVGPTKFSITGLTACRAALTVDVDIKPQSCPNPLNPKSKGVLPAAVLGTESLDVKDIDPTTIKLEGVPAIRSDLEDVATPYNGDEPCGCNDLNGDGYMDLTLKFEKEEVLKMLDIEALAGQTVPLTITGKLRKIAGGQEFTGKDCVKILDKRVLH